MADNIILDANTTTGAEVRTIDRSGVETPISLIDVGGTSAESLIGDAGVYLPVAGAAAENAAAAGNPILVGARYDATPRTLGDGDVGAIAIDADGAVHISDGGNSITVDSTVLDSINTLLSTTGILVTRVNRLIPGTTALDLGKAIDSTAGATDTGVAALVVRDDALTTLTPVDGDYVPLRVGSTGALWTTVSGTVTVGSHDVTNAGTFAVQAAQSGTWNVGTVTAVTAISNALPTGSNTIGKVNVPAVATGGATPGKLISAATTNATSVKGSAGTLYSLCCFNTNASARYLKFYNKASAPTVGTDTPVQVFTIPGNTAGAGFVVPIPTSGIAFSTGIAFATTTGAADSDTGAVALNEIVVSYSYL